MFIADHRNQVVTENDLAVVVELRTDYIDRFVRVRREKTALCQLLRQKSTDNFRALHADNRVDHGVIQIHANQRLCNFLRLFRSRFQGRHINVIIDMCMVCCEMSWTNL